MKKLIFTLFFGLSIWTANSQCAFNNTFIFDATPPCPGTFNIGCMNPGQYVTVNVITGNIYTFTTCGGGGFFDDTELTLYNGAGTVVLASNDDDCGLLSTINWTSTLTGTVNLLLDEFPCASSGTCIDVEITCTPPVQSGNGCNTDVTICTPGLAGPFGFNTPGPPVSSCLDFFGPDYAYIILYITASGPLDLLIDGDAGTGFLDVAIFDVTGSLDPCGAINNVGNEIGCNYADFSDGCNQFGNTFPCGSSVPAPNVVAGDVVMIVVENWSGTSTSFTLDLAPPPSAQTGPPDPTINPVGPFCDTDAPVQLTAANMGGDWTGTGVSLTGMFDPAAAGVGSFAIDYSIGQPPCQAQSQTTIDVIDCSTCTITNFTANVSACNILTNDYTTSGQVTFTNPPLGGQLTVTDCNGVQQVFNAPFVSPINYNLTGQTADGAACDVTAVFTADPLCTQNIGYVAPICLCNIDNFNVNISACQAGSVYMMDGTIDYTSPPGGGTLIIQVDNGTTIYDTIINPPFTSPDNFSISGIPADGSNSTITVFFSANPACTQTINYVATAPCGCGADIGTFTANITGSSPNNYVLCYGDQIDINTNNDWVEPGEMFAPPGPIYDPGISWLIYSCPPTVALVPNLITDIPDDPCLLGLVSDFNFSDVNDLGWINAYPPGTFTNNTIYFVPITMYSIVTGTYSYVNTAMPCYELGTPYAVQYLPDFTFSITEDCATASATATINGGLPAIDGSNFTASNLLPVTASFANTTCTDGGTIVVNGLSGGDMYSFTITDGNGCPYTVTGGPFIPTPVINAGPDQTICIGAPVTLTGTGAGVGGTYVWDNGVTQATPFNPVATLTYTVTGTDAMGCINTDQVVVTVNPLPIVGAGSDQTICAGDAVVLNGTGANTYVWDNGVTDGVIFNPAATLTYTVTGTDVNLCVNTDQVLVTVNPLPVINAGLDQTICAGDPVTLTGSGAGVGGVYAWDNGVVDGVVFNPVANTTYTVTGTDANLCTSTDQVDVIINPIDDPSFNYPLGLTYCQTSADPTPVVTGLAGGTFSYVPTVGGPFLDINTATGTVANLTSDIGTYDITYNTAGAPGSLCPQTSTLSLTVTDAPIADFTFGVYCANDIDPTPTFINGGSGGIFTAAPAGLSINPATGLVDLSASTPGTYTVTNTINIAGCALATFNDDITVNGLPDANIAGTTTICPGAPLPDITINITAGLAPWNLTYNFNGAPVNIVVAASPFTLAGAAVGSYDLVSVTDANGCTSAIAGNATISLFPTPVMGALVPQGICEGTNLNVQGFTSDIVGSTFAWTNTTGIDVGFGLSGNGQIPPFLATNGTGVNIPVTVSVTPTSPNGCVGLPVDFIITVYPIPIVSFTGQITGCEPLTVTLTNTSSPVGSDCLWDFGNGSSALGCVTVTNTYSAGVFDVTLSVTTADGCFGTVTYNDYITVSQLPEAAFAFSPQILNVDETVVEFNNNSLFATSYTWDYGDDSPQDNFIDPTHTYPQVPGEYIITLWAYNGVCYDSIQQMIIVEDVIIFYVPNVFTPDHDEFNEGFHPVFTSGYDPFDYHLTIFNRWGEIVFESYDALYGWDGTYSDQGLVQDGVYVWQIEFKETMSDKRHTHRGHVTVLK